MEAYLEPTMRNSAAILRMTIKAKGALQFARAQPGERFVSRGCAMRKTLGLCNSLLALMFICGGGTLVLAQQPSSPLRTASNETAKATSSNAEWLRAAMAREAAHPGQGTVMVSYSQDTAVANPQGPSVIAPETQIQFSANATALAAQPPTAEDNKMALQPSQQPASPVRTIPELTVPNTSLQGIGTGNTPQDAMRDYPIEEIGLPVGVNRSGDWSHLCACWQASGTCHLPLYFEEPMLERHGQQRYPCLQPMISGVRFIGNVALLPYYMQLDPPWEEQSTLGSYRPGSSAPALYHRPPYRADAVTAQGLATAAIFIAVP
jgi:hypothetical protein